MAHSPKPIVRVTQIEAFRRYLQQSENDLFEITEQSVIDAVTGQFQGNDLTRIGTAFHQLVQHGAAPCVQAQPAMRTYTRYGRTVTERLPAGLTYNIQGHGVTLDMEQVNVALTYRCQHPQAFHEVRRYADYGPAIVTGCADMIDGLHIRDIKTKFSQPADTPYIQSCQWRFYLDIFQADVFHFDIFTFQGYNAQRHQADVRALPLIPHTPPVTLYRYEALHADVTRLLLLFLQWVEAKGLMRQLADSNINL